MLTIIITCVFEENGKLCPQIYLEECLYESQKCCFKKNWRYFDCYDYCDYYDYYDDYYYDYYDYDYD